MARPIRQRDLAAPVLPTSSQGAEAKGAATIALERADQALADVAGCRKDISALIGQQFELVAMLGHLRELVASRMPEPSDPVAALEQLEASLRVACHVLGCGQDVAPGRRYCARHDAEKAAEQREIDSQERPSARNATALSLRGDHAATDEAHPLADRGTSAPSRIAFVVGDRVLARHAQSGWWEGIVTALAEGLAEKDFGRAGKMAWPIDRLLRIPEGI